MKVKKIKEEAKHESKFIIPEYLKTFSQAQLEVILSRHPKKQVVAGAGSGKTRTMIGLLEYSLREKLEKKERVLVLSFSRKAVAEFKERLPNEFRDFLEVSTFHAFCLHHLKILYPRALKKIQILTDEMKEKFIFDFLSQAETISIIGGIPIPVLWEHQEDFAFLFPELYKKTIKAFHEYKKKHYLFEFEDLISYMLKTLKGPKRQDLQKKYDLIIVDEFQDTDPRQLEFLRLMNPPRLVVVGDDWQAIYAFRGASLTPFLRFQKLFNAKIFHLGINYRSVPSIVNMGVRIIRASNKQLPKKVSSFRRSPTSHPVMSVELESEELQDFYKVVRPYESSYKILSRTNFQCAFWQKHNFNQENTMTIHKSKGLEFPIVFLDLLGGWTRREKEKSRKKLTKKDTTAWDEEIRILYVGASRAMNLLVVLHLPHELSGDKESFFYERLIAPKAKKCTLENLRATLVL